MTEPMLLHPMGLMEIALHSFRIYFRNLPILLSLAAFLFGPPVILIALGAIFLAPESNVIAVILFVLGILGFLAALFYFYAAATLAVSLHVIGLKAGSIQILRRLRGTVAIQLLGTGFLQGLAILGGLLLLIIPGVIFFVRFSFASPVVILERTAYARGMRRSRELVNGYWWRIFRAFLLINLGLVTVYLIIGLILSIPLAVVGLSWQEAFEVGIVIGEYLVAPVAFIYPVLLYYDLRIRKEAFNIETIREAI